MKSGTRSYVLLTAAYNEESHIEETITSVLAQSELPEKWVIVSDGSTDRTDEIVQRWSRNHGFIYYVRREKDENRGFASKVAAIHRGLQITPVTSEFIGHLDGDVGLEPDYFHDLLDRFEQDPRLGIGGGWYTENVNGRFCDRRGNTERSIPGGIQMFRRACYDDIGEMLPIEYGGEDWYMEVMARMHDWRVRAFPELRVRHLRPSGRASGTLRYCFRSGYADFALGSHPLFELAKLARKTSSRPFLIGALARLSGFTLANINGKRITSPEFVRFLRQEQLARLFSKPLNRNDCAGYAAQSEISTRTTPHP